MLKTTQPNKGTSQMTSQTTSHGTSQLEFTTRNANCALHVQPDFMTPTGGMSSAFASRAAMARLLEGHCCAIDRSSLSVLRGIPETRQNASTTEERNATTSHTEGKIIEGNVKRRMWSRSRMSVQGLKS